MRIAIIPARGGSKRIPKKNIRVFCGRPMIEYSIEAAQKSGVFDRVIVSTDSDEIAKVAERLGAEVPFRRSKSLADDHVGTGRVIADAWARFEDRAAVSYVCCIYATAPFIRSEDLRRGLEMIQTRKVSSVFTITSFPFPIFRSLRREESGHVAMFWPENMKVRSNDLPEAYHDAGQFYWLDPATIKDDVVFYSEDALGLVLPRHLVQDIDTEEDWVRAELMFQALNMRKAQA
ncbi:pseudaminic acid cytidylyltransferase [Ferrovibrio terrae]|uniref:pseudaminic acid cytidylyltransferase n=1 Tax=Ferrovibrio terrae TaxID=2594003 RepID=UPI0031378F55